MDLIKGQHIYKYLYSVNQENGITVQYINQRKKNNFSAQMKFFFNRSSSTPTEWLHGDHQIACAH